MASHSAFNPTGDGGLVTVDADTVDGKHAVDFSPYYDPIPATEDSRNMEFNDTGWTIPFASWHGWSNGSNGSISRAEGENVKVTVSTLGPTNPPVIYARIMQDTPIVYAEWADNTATRLTLTGTTNVYEIADSSGSVLGTEAIWLGYDAPSMYANGDLRASLTDEPGSLTLSIGGHGFYIANNRPIWMDMSLELGTSDFDVVMKGDENAAGMSYCGMVVTDLDVVSLSTPSESFACAWIQTMTTTQVAAYVNPAANQKTQNGGTSLTSRVSYLRMKRVGTNMVFLVSSDGKLWKVHKISDVGTTPYSRFGILVGIGYSVSVSSASLGSPFTLPPYAIAQRIDYIRWLS